MDLDKFKVALPLGFAIFAMFFGAGNLIFPVLLGAEQQNNIIVTIFGFLLTGVGVPLIGLFAIILYQGNYWNFFSSLGKIPANILIFILVILLGVTTANPRCSLITYETLSPYLPHFNHDRFIFNLIFFSLVFLVNVKKSQVIDLIGQIFSPIKLFLLIVLIVAAIILGHPQNGQSNSQIESLIHAMVTGYGTMDLLAAFFFCTLIYRHIATKIENHKKLQVKDKIPITFYACIIGAGLLSTIYSGFIIAASYFSSTLSHLTADKLISAIAIAVFGTHAALLICLMVSFACFVTAVSLTAIVVDYIEDRWLQDRAKYKHILLGVLLCVFCVSNLSFAKIMSFSIPILQILYPALVVFTCCRIINYFFVLRVNTWLFYVAIINSLFFSVKTLL